MVENVVLYQHKNVIKNIKLWTETTEATSIVNQNLTIKLMIKFHVIHTCHTWHFAWFTYTISRSVNTRWQITSNRCNFCAFVEKPVTLHQIFTLYLKNNQHWMWIKSSKQTRSSAVADMPPGTIQSMHRAAKCISVKCDHNIPKLTLKMRQYVP